MLLYTPFSFSSEKSYYSTFKSESSVLGVFDRIGNSIRWLKFSQKGHASMEGSKVRYRKYFHDFALIPFR